MFLYFFIKFFFQIIFNIEIYIYRTYTFFLYNNIKFSPILIFKIVLACSMVDSGCLLLHPLRTQTAAPAVLPVAKAEQ